MPRLEGKNVLITGASSGIGQAIAVRFAQEGANVAINYLAGPEEAQATQATVRQACLEARGPGGRDLIVQADISREDQVKSMFSQVVEAFGSLDVLVNNAGIQKPCATEDIEMADFDRVMNVNLRGAFLCAREAVRRFLAQGGGGAILNNSSVHEIIPKPKYLPYSISKGGMENLTKSMALEYASRGIRVNAVGPGAVVPGDLLEDTGPGYPPARSILVSSSRTWSRSRATSARSSASSADTAASPSADSRGAGGVLGVGECEWSGERAPESSRAIADSR